MKRNSRDFKSRGCFVSLGYVACKNKMKLPFSFSDSGFRFCLYWPFIYLSELLLSTPQEDDLNSVVLRGLVIVGLPLPVGLIIFWWAYHKSFKWQTAREDERKDFLKREKTPWLKQLALVNGAMLLTSSLTALLVYSFYLITGYATISISLWLLLAATLASYLFAALVALWWLAMCDRTLRATQTSTS